MENQLISVIIPTYNHANYLKKAINSVLLQTYTNFEIIVMDDGSTDNTKEVISEFGTIKYIYQDNAGLSAARNNSIPHSKGEFLIFLDADDWLYPEALSIQMDYFIKYPELSFVSGAHSKIFVDENKFFKNSDFEIIDNHFLRLLQFNYIAHPAAAMFRRHIFDKYIFDPHLKSCQDYDLYLYIAKNYNTVHHSQFVSAYRLHSNNMSSNYAHMLREILDIMLKHKAFISSEEERKAYKAGRKLVIDFYIKGLYWNKLRKFHTKATEEEKMVLRKYKPSLYFKYLGNYLLKR